MKNVIGIDTLMIELAEGRMAEAGDAAQSLGISVNAFITLAIEERLASSKHFPFKVSMRTCLN